MADLTSPHHDVLMTDVYGLLYNYNSFFLKTSLK